MTILCKFADVPDEPAPVAYFERLFSDSYPGLDHYWREVSYGAIDLTGSTVVGWYVLPLPQDAYRLERPARSANSAAANARVPPPTADLQRLAEDCAAAAGSAVDWQRYVGLNLVFNARLDLPRGGQVCLEADGKDRLLSAPRGSGRHSFATGVLGTRDGAWVRPEPLLGRQRQRVRQSVGCDERGGAMRGRSGRSTLGWPTPRRLPEGCPGLDSRQPQVRGRGGCRSRRSSWSSLRSPARDGYLLAVIPHPRCLGWTGRAVGRSLRLPNPAATTTRWRRGAGLAMTPRCPAKAVIIHEVNLDGDPQVRPVSGGWPVSHGGAGAGLAARWTPGEFFRDDAARRLGVGRRGHADRLRGHDPHPAAAAGACPAGPAARRRRASCLKRWLRPSSVRRW